ncbi:MAG: GAF domain-containing protein [Ignavibacteria bacterium]|jgi:GAF domain-containing protein
MTDVEIYKSIEPQVESLLDSNDSVLTNLSNFTALLSQSFEKISWVGFYITKGDKLILGPFQGKVACTKIEFGKGVCGTSARNKATVIVEDVHKFPGHIACDEGSNSEIVLPIIVKDKVWGVLDLDSYEFSAFNEIDKLYLERFCEALINKLDLEKFIIS